MQIKKLKAVTVLELIVAMLISSIVIIMAYSSYSMFSRLFFTFRNNSELSCEILQADRFLRKETDQSSVILKSGDGIDLYSAAGRVHYFQDADYLVREFGSMKDSFYIPSAEIGFFFNQTEQFTEGQPVDRISIKYKRNIEDEDELHLEYYKIYGAAIYMNKDNTRWQE
jgi:hypothetical protein